ncbi:MAG: imidazole glycerol phosphate synthase subunit HisH [Treponema sp.]|nr:imidazole glycerol phosphate synthase subunit HisH [Treponema sp.]
MTGIIDYNAGNIRSVERALNAIGAPYVASKNPHELVNCNRLIFPGDGDAAYAMLQLKRTGIDSFLADWVASQKQLLGICVGSQVIFEYSEEGDVQCLGFAKGAIRHFSSLWNEKAARKVPHMGWNDLTYANGSSPLFDGVTEHTNVYFVHSYVIQPEDEMIVKAYADYGVHVPACVSFGSVTAFQFHPEKSGSAGLRMLQNFCKDDFACCAASEKNAARSANAPHSVNALNDSDACGISTHSADLHSNEGGRNC